MKKIKKVGNIVAVCLFSCGIFGFIIFLGCRSNPHFAMPIGSVNSVFVDKKGLIYVGCTDAARVQVFDNDGNYLYSNIFNTLGTFYFFLGNDGVVSVYTPRENMGYVFQGQELISESKCAQEFENSTIRLFKNEMHTTKSFYDSSENSYRVDGKKVSIKRAEADGYSKIQFKAPIFPLGFSICGVIFWLGVMIFVFVNQETIARLMPEE